MSGFPHEATLCDNHSILFLRCPYPTYNLFHAFIIFNNTKIRQIFSISK